MLRTQTHSSKCNSNQLLLGERISSRRRNSCIIKPIILWISKIKLTTKTNNKHKGAVVAIPHLLANQISIIETMVRPWVLVRREAALANRKIETHRTCNNTITTKMAPQRQAVTKVVVLENNVFLHSRQELAWTPTSCVETEETQQLQQVLRMIEYPSMAKIICPTIRDKVIIIKEDPTTLKTIMYHRIVQKVPWVTILLSSMPIRQALKALWAMKWSKIVIIIKINNIRTCRISRREPTMARISNNLTMDSVNKMQMIPIYRIRTFTDSNKWIKQTRIHSHLWEQTAMMMAAMARQQLVMQIQMIRWAYTWKIIW